MAELYAILKSTMFNLPHFPGKTFRKVLDIESLSIRKNDLYHFFRVYIIVLSLFIINNLFQ